MVRPGAVLLVVRQFRDGPAVEVEAEVLKALGPHGGPPFLVRWSDTNLVSLFAPDDDAFIQRQGSPSQRGPEEVPRYLLGNRA